MLQSSYITIIWAGLCTNELQLKVNCSKKFGLVCQLLAEPAHILFYNSLSAAIHLYMIRPLIFQGLFRNHILFIIYPSCVCTNFHVRNLTDSGYKSIKTSLGWSFMSCDVQIIILAKYTPFVYVLNIWGSNSVGHGSFFWTWNLFFYLLFFSEKKSCKKYYIFLQLLIYSLGNMYCIFTSHN